MRQYTDIRGVILAAGVTAAVVGGARSVSAQVDGSIIAPQSYSFSFQGFFTNPDNLINQSGIGGTYVSGTTDFDSLIASSVGSDGNGNAFVCNSNAQNQPNGVVNTGETLTFDVGTAMPLNAIGLWSTNTASQALTAFELHADDDDDFANGTSGLLGSYLAEVTSAPRVYGFDLTNTRYVHLVVTGHAASDFLRINEVAFRHETPLVSNTTQGTMHITLQDALDNASSGDAITIAAGTLFEDNIVFPTGLDVTITGVGSDQTFIDGGMGASDTPIFDMVGTSQSSATIIANLTLQNGTNNAGTGGGAVRLSGSAPTFTGVRFLNNSGNGRNAHVLANTSTCRFEQCQFLGGAGARAVGVSGRAPVGFVQCLFAESQVLRAIEPGVGASAHLSNCTITGFGRSLEVLGTVVATNCVMDGAVVGSGTITTHHCLYAGAPASNGNIDGTPTYVDAGNGDYRLAPGSLGIDAADYDAYITAGGVTQDLAGAWRRVDAAPADSGVGAFTYLDMGAYETASLSSDCNSNGLEDSTDLTIKGAYTDFGSDDGHAYTLNGTNPIVGDGSIRLTEAGVQNQLASAVFDPQIAQPIDDFRVSFDAQFIFGSGFGADGISFALLSKDSYDSSALFGEGGPGAGSLTISISEYITQSVTIVADGVVLDSAPVPMNINDGNWHHFVVERSSGVITVTLTPWAGQPIVLATATDSTPYDALYGFGSRTGADTNEHRIDNVRFEAMQANDCDANGVPDDCDPDTDADGTPDACECPCDIDATDGVAIGDLLAYLTGWFAQTDGPAPMGPGSGADFNADDLVDVTDLLAFLSCWFSASQGAPCI